jgi:hypothetical protein
LIPWRRFECDSFASKPELKAGGWKSMDGGMDVSDARKLKEPRLARNGPLREALVSLARQKPRYGYRRLHPLLTRRKLIRLSLLGAVAKSNRGPFCKCHAKLPPLSAWDTGNAGQVLKHPERISKAVASAPGYISHVAVGLAWKLLF